MESGGRTRDELEKERVRAAAEIKWSIVSDQRFRPVFVRYVELYRERSHSYSLLWCHLLWCIRVPILFPPFCHRASYGASLCLSCDFLPSFHQHAFCHSLVLFLSLSFYFLCFLLVERWLQQPLSPALCSWLWFPLRTWELLPHQQLSSLSSFPFSHVFTRTFIERCPRKDELRIIFLINN